VWVELVFMMLILKLPAIYLAYVCWYAVRAEPRPPEGALLAVTPEPDAPPAHQARRHRSLPRPPRGGPARGYPRVARAAPLRAELRK
jgi:hypothetical protein